MNKTRDVELKKIGDHFLKGEFDKAMKRMEKHDKKLFKQIEDITGGNVSYLRIKGVESKEYVKIERVYKKLPVTDIEKHLMAMITMDYCDGLENCQIYSKRDLEAYVYFKTGDTSFNFGEEKNES